MVEVLLLEMSCIIHSVPDIISLNWKKNLYHLTVLILRCRQGKDNVTLLQSNRM